mgnify:FL=1
MSRRKRNPFEDMIDAWLDSIIAVPMVSTRYPQVNNVDDINIGTWDDANGHITATFDMPGVEKKDIDLNVDINSVSVKANNEDREYSYSHDFTFSLNPDEVKATFNNGVLDIKIQKAEESKGIKIDIE